MLCEKYSSSAMIFCMCKHNFHSKCYTEEIENVKTHETRNKVDQKPECPICRKFSVSVEEKQRKRIKASKRRRENKNLRDSGNDSSDEGLTSGSNVEDSNLQSIEPPTEEEVQRRRDMNYKFKLGAFDEDYAASMPTIVFK